MKTHVIISPDGDVISDDKAVVYARNRIGKTVTVGTGIMVDAFRLLRAQGEIEELTLTFCNGVKLLVGKDGRVEGWPADDEITEASTKILLGLLDSSGWKS